jgi:hypothetical protein
MAKYGPTIWAELEAAGLGGLPIMQEGDEVLTAPGFPDDKREIFNAVLAAHDPNRTITPPKGPVETAIRALIDEGVIPANKVQTLLSRVLGK